MNLNSLAFNNLRRNKLRTLLTVAAVTLATLAFVTLRTVMSSWLLAAEHTSRERLVTRHKVSMGLQLPISYVNIVRGVPGVKQVAWALWFGGKLSQDPNLFFSSLAVPPAEFLAVYEKDIVTSKEGRQRWLNDRQGAIIGDVLAQKAGLHVGDQVTLVGTIFPGEWSFVIDDIYTPLRKSVDRAQFLFHYDYLNQAISERRQGRVGWIISSLQPNASSAEVSTRINKALDLQDTPTATMDEHEFGTSFFASVSSIILAIDMVSGVLLAIMAMILANVIAMSIRERTHEYAILRAIGFRASVIRSLLLKEALAAGAISSITGILITYPIVEYGIGYIFESRMGNFFPSFHVQPEIFAVSAIFPVIISVLASLMPARRITKLLVCDALRRID